MVRAVPANSQGAGVASVTRMPSAAEVPPDDVISLARTHAKKNASGGDTDTDSRSPGLVYRPSRDSDRNSRSARTPVFRPAGDQDAQEQQHEQAQDRAAPGEQEDSRATGRGVGQGGAGTRGSGRRWGSAWPRRQPGCGRRRSAAQGHDDPAGRGADCALGARRLRPASGLAHAAPDVADGEQGVAGPPPACGTRGTPALHPPVGPWPHSRPLWRIDQLILVTDFRRFRGQLGGGQGAGHLLHRRRRGSSPSTTPSWFSRRALTRTLLSSEPTAWL